jgi:hypothetical protein
MSPAVYTINPYDRVLTDSEREALWLHDLPRDAEELHIQALAASGDYFEMLASGLEQIAVNLPIGSDQLEHYVGQLLYLQLHYMIAKK